MTPEEEELAYQHLGTRDPQCVRCAESHPAALTGEYPDIICTQCAAAVRGWAPYESHHPAGRHNSPITVAIPANDHRVLSLWQSRWPSDALENPQNSPLLSVAAR
jgi:hypothetical protein